MGLVNFGVPEKETEFLKEILKLDIFVEGGTYQGGTAKNMSDVFRTVLTIEKSDVMYDKAKENLNDILNVTMLKGDTREHLHSILKSYDNILLWLDAHWSGGQTYGEKDECPLIEELKIIFGYNKNYAVLIDDARLFLAPPPSPHVINEWPSLTDIVKIIPDNWELIVFKDVIYIIPESVSYQFKSFLQNLITKEYSKNKDNFLQKLIKKMRLTIVS